MEPITYLQLKTNLPMIQQINHFECFEQINEHTQCYLTAIIHEENKDDYVKQLNAEKKIEIYAQTQQGEISLFKGFIKELEIQFVGGMYVLELKGISSSFEADLEKKKRSFQDQQMTYENLIKGVIRAYQGGDTMDFASEGKTLGQLVVQYEETDWEFMKRLASHFNQGIVPASTYDKPKIFFGVPKGQDRGVLEEYHYKIKKDIAYYKKASENTNPEYAEIDAVAFEVETLENYAIGDIIYYQNAKLYIKSKKVVLKEGLVYFQYELCTRRGLTQNKIYNEKIVGVSLKGKVLQSIKDKIKVHLEVDKSQEIEKAWEFPYSTLYTAEGQSGWYCMPEKGDTVFIYFKEAQEVKAVGLNALRVGDKGTDKIQNPAIKYFRTIAGKEIKFSEEEIVITCINGVDEETGESQVVYIKLNQTTGIEIISSQPITFKSDKNIQLEAGEEIHITAKEQIKLRCKQSEIRMDTMVDICGPDVKIN
jgi:hypothetical protein